MDLDAVLTAALKAIDKAGVPDDLKPIAFAKAIDILSPPPSTRPSAASSGPTSDGSTRSGADRSEGDETIGLKKVGDYFGLGPDDLDELFSEHEGSLQIAVDTGELGPTTAAQAKSLALLMIAGRQIGGYDPNTTALETVRTECDRHGVYDSANFSTQMNSLKAFFNVNGEKTGRTFKLKPSGRKEAKRIVAGLVGSD